MKFLRDILDKQKPLFAKGGKYEKFHYLFEAGETFMFVPNEVTPKKGAQIRDAIDLKRLECWSSTFSIFWSKFIIY